MQSSSVDRMDKEVLQGSTEFHTAGQEYTREVNLPLCLAKVQFNTFSLHPLALVIWVQQLASLLA